MRGKDTQQSAIFSYVSPGERVPTDHPLRPMRVMVDAALKALSPSFNKMYENFGSPSILLRALLLQVLYSVRSERMLMEQLEFNRMFRWFVGSNVDDAVWVPTVFSKNRDRLLNGDIARKFFEQVLEQVREAKLTSDEHFSVDGTLVEAGRARKAFNAKTSPSNRLKTVTRVIQQLTFMAKREAMRRANQRRTWKLVWHARAAGTKRSWHPVAMS